MSSLDKAMQNLKYDTRMLEINLRAGTLTQEEAKKHLEQLPDSGNNCEKLDLEDDQQSQNSSEQH